MPPDGTLTLDELGAAVRTSDIDTVIVGFCDMQGRLMGKRVHAPGLPRRHRGHTGRRAATTCSPSTST